MQTVYITYNHTCIHTYIHTYIDPIQSRHPAETAKRVTFTFTFTELWKEGGGVGFGPMIPTVRDGRFGAEPVFQRSSFILGRGGIGENLKESS